MSKIEKIMDDMIKHASTAGKVKSSSANIKLEKKFEFTFKTESELFKAEMGDRVKAALADRKVEIGKQLFSREKDSLSQLDKLINPEE